MVARTHIPHDLLIELIRQGRLIDHESAATPVMAAVRAAVLIGRQGALENGDILLVRDADGD